MLYLGLGVLCLSHEGDTVFRLRLYFLDGQPVDDTSRPLKTHGNTAQWEMIVLTGEPGG